MASINSVVLVGNLTRDAELKYSSSGTAIMKMGLAVNRTKKTATGYEKEVHFFDAVMIGKSAEAVQKYLIKGKEIGINGELRQNRWEQDGKSRSNVEIFINELQLLGGKEINERSNGAGDPSRKKEVFEDDILF